MGNRKGFFGSAVEPYGFWSVSKTLGFANSRAINVAWLQGL
jgi:hypothetical protein